MGQRIQPGWTVRCEYCILNSSCWQLAINDVYMHNSIEYDQDLNATYQANAIAVCERQIALAG